jgi:hypothetical protein
MHDTTGNTHTSANLVLIIYNRCQRLSQFKQAQPSEQNPNAFETENAFETAGGGALRDLKGFVWPCSKVKTNSNKK